MISQLLLLNPWYLLSLRDIWAQVLSLPTATSGSLSVGGPFWCRGAKDSGGGVVDATAPVKPGQ